MRERWKTLLELGRVSNLPTTLSNVTAGYILGGGSLFEYPQNWLAAGFVTICMYEGGMVLNDVCDTSIDQIERPSRPIPSGRISRMGAFWISTVLFALGILATALLFKQGLFLAVALLGVIVLYNLSHHFFPLAPILMGSCRGLVYLLAATAAGWKVSLDVVSAMALVLSLYVAIVSFIARDEVSARITWAHGLGFSLTLMTVILPIALPPHFNLLSLLALSMAFGWLFWMIWSLFKGRLTLMGAVGRTLAGISLLDAIVLTRVNGISGVLMSWLCFMGARLWQRKVRPT